MNPLLFTGAISTREEFFYPDTPLGVLPDSLSLCMPKNGKPGIQLLLKTEASAVPLTLESEAFSAEWFEMQAIPVEYNTGNDRDQGGAMVLSHLTEAPDYATRLAPFTVYDCLRPIRNGTLPVKDGLAALYCCPVLREGVPAGVHTAVLRAGEYVCRLSIRVYDITVPEDTFPVTNWFSLEAIRRFHQVREGTPDYCAMVTEYGRLMRRAHQTMFYLNLDEKCMVSREPCRFDFSHLEPLIAAFKSAGLSTLELGPLLSRGFLPSGLPDMKTGAFTCAMAPDVPVSSPEGYAITVQFVQALANFLTAHGWEKDVVFHIHDEPDIHCPDDAALQSRKRDYYLAAGILRKYLPGVRTIEAVATPTFRGGVDIWVPGTAGYEKHKAEFDRMTALGEEVWAYVCCGPSGNWLNRFLDFAVLKGRLLFWGCAKNRLAGFLHWGFNQYLGGMDPFKGSSCPNHTGLGTNFPCGDAFIVYPGTDGPWPGMRLEAARRGAEDAALLQLLRQRDEPAHDALVQKVFRTNTDYNDDPAFFQSVYEELLRLLEKSPS